MAFFSRAAVLAILLRLSSGQKYDYGYTYNVQPADSYSANRSYASITRASTPCRCGYKFASSRIVGGAETGVNEFPMMALVIYGGMPAIRWGGTIIDKRYVLSCAHTFIYGTSNLFIVVGEHDVTTFEESPATKVFEVESVLIHPHYYSKHHYNDIALLRVNEDIAFSDRVGPACLPFSFQDKLFDFAGHTMTLVGWGRLEFEGRRTNVLRKVDVEVITQDACHINYPCLTTHQICTDSPLKDACQGDSGGPVLYTDPASSLLFLCGIISYGNGCARTGGVHTRVTAFLAWILNNTPGAEYCNK